MTTQTLSIKRSPSIALPRINLRVVLFFAICTAIFLSVLYIFQINKMIAGGYMVKNYQKQAATLAQEGKTIELSLAEGDSLDVVKVKSKALGFKKVESIKYIKVLDASLAQR